MNAQADIDLVLPCYNPPSGWEERVATHFREVERLFSPVRFHLFIVSDGSRRGYEPETIDRLRQLIPNVCVVDYKPNRGKGYALREAVKRCTSPYIIYTDYDFPYTNDSFGRMVETLLGGADVVVATRSKSYQENLPPFRKVLSKLSHICNTWILRIKIKDTQGGMKGFSQAGQAIFLTTRINSFLFDTEFIYKASRRKEINFTDDQCEHQRRTSGIRYGIQGPAAGSVELLIHLIS